MKRLGKRLLRVLTLALALTIAAVLLPYARDWLGAYLPQGKYERASRLLSHEMQRAGELTAVRHVEQGVMKTETNALFIGSVQSVSVPYTYEIGLGFSLDEVRLTPTERSISVAVPEIRMLYDSFQPSGEAEVHDFWYRLTEKQYQKMLDDQAAACREKYLGDADAQAQAWDAACEALRTLLSQMAGEKLPLAFERAGTN